MEKNKLIKSKLTKKEIKVVKDFIKYYKTDIGVLVILPFVKILINTVRKAIVLGLETTIKRNYKKIQKSKKHYQR